ncbi:pilus assembly PilX family protein [Massilia endophytica]|uniref:pilus assembly PilX family protein n=1 Tax=Massilia endophytica TaxID=2899220 RepID=UPI001E28382A|nr:PilX N-terminal domain-containing pilus assembly protein [Massilia endophytica]UGQ47792.1 pilus assembly protein [Massilia endophytica]
MRTRQDGITLLLTILLLLGVLILGASAAKLALSGEKAARAERDRHIAFQAAEDALMDAERDIDGKAGPGRQAMFDSGRAESFVPGCGRGDAAGLCAAGEGAPPAWQAVDIADGPSASHGQFTGADMQTGQGPLPWRRPRYIVERLPYKAPGAPADAAPAYYYRVTVLGFGAREGTEVVLQSSYRRTVDE